MVIDITPPIRVFLTWPKCRVWALGSYN